MLGCMSLQNFVVAGGSQNGTIAVITLPLSYVRGSPGQTTTLTLDAQNSSPKPGTTLTQWVWAVISIPDKRAITNSTGRITQIRLRPGGWCFCAMHNVAGTALLIAASSEALRLFRMHTACTALVPSCLCVVWVGPLQVQIAAHLFPPVLLHPTCRSVPDWTARAG